MRSASSLIPALLLCVGPALACNPDPPVPPILEGHDYDSMAMEYLIRDSDTVALARYESRVDLLIEGESEGAGERTRYVFTLTEGWKKALPARLVVPGYWLSCELPMRVGGKYLMYLAGSVPAHILPAETAAAEIATLGDLDWFYSQTGELIRPDLLQDLGRAPGPEEDGPGEDGAGEDGSAEGESRGQGTDREQAEDR